MTVKTATLRIVGEYTMHCNSCAKGVTMALKRVPGVLYVGADHQSQEIDVTLNSDETPLHSVKKMLEQLGYEVKQKETI